MRKLSLIFLLTGRDEKDIYIVAYGTFANICNGANEVCNSKIARGI